MRNQKFFRNISSKTQEKEAPQENILDFFLLNTLKTTFWMENWTQRWTQSGLSFQGQSTVFTFQKGQWRPPLFSLVAGLWVWLNRNQYPWICLNIVENTWINCSDYVRAMNMPDHLKCLTSFWKCQGF